MPTKSQYKNATLEEYLKKYRYDIFVETGTWKGDCIQAWKGRFRKIISIELGKDIYLKAKERFKNDKNVELINGDSGDVLKWLVPDLKEPVIFLLDAHYSFGKTAKGEIETPIREELEAILKSDLPHVVIIDDARCYTGENDYPTVSEIDEMMKHKYTRSIKDDFIRYEPINI